MRISNKKLKVILKNGQLNFNLADKGEADVEMVFQPNPNGESQKAYGKKEINQTLKNLYNKYKPNVPHT